MNVVSTLLALHFALATPQGGQPPRLQVAPDYRSSELLLEWFRQPSNNTLIDAMAGEPGIQVMADQARLAAGPSAPLRSFREELEAFRRKETTGTSGYGVAVAWDTRAKASHLLREIKNRRLETTVVERALEYMPEEFSSREHYPVYYVLTGWEWGDAYVCRVRRDNGRLTISADGEPAMVINLSLVARSYGATAEDQLNALSGVLSHEMFHLAFASYTKKLPGYSPGRPGSPTAELLALLQNEGIAHYVHRKGELVRGYDTKPDLREKEGRSFTELNDAFATLADPGAPEAAKKELLTRASVGKYWAKYGAIAGMFMAYHIERHKGRAALHDSVRKGPASFVKQYLDVQKAHHGLPALAFDSRKLAGNERMEER